MKSEPDKKVIEKLYQTVSEPSPQPQHQTVTPVTPVQKMSVKPETSQPPLAVQHVFVEDVPPCVVLMFPAEPEPKFIMYEGK